MKKEPTQREILAANLDHLRANHPQYRKQEAIAQKSGVAQTTIGRILRKEVAATIDNVDAIARVYGLRAADLLDPDLPTRPQKGEIPGEPELIKLYRSVVHIDHAREAILRAARNEAALHATQQTGTDAETKKTVTK